MIRRAANLTGRRRDFGGDAALGSAHFHSVANRLLRQHAGIVGLDPGFTLLDREDSADLIDAVRTEARSNTGREW